MALKFHQNHPIFAFLLALLFTQNILYTAFVVSGGRVRGDSFTPDGSSTIPVFRSGGYPYHSNNIMINLNPGWFFVLFGIIVAIFLVIGYLNKPRVLKIQVFRLLAYCS